MRGEAGNFVTQTLGWNGGHLLSSDFPPVFRHEKKKERVPLLSIILV